MSGQIVRRLSAVAAVCVVTLGAAPYAAAEPAGGAVIDAPTLSLPDLGGPEQVSFYGETSTTALSFAVPPGVTPATLNVTVDLPFPMRSGLLSVMQDEKLISKVGLPLNDMAPLVIPLPGVQVRDDRVDLSLTLAGLSEDRFCLDDLNPVDFVNGTVTFAGREAPPTNLADFLPAVLRKITVALPPKPTQAESNAAVELVTELVARYRSQSPEVLVVPLAEGASTIDAPSLPLERQFVVKENPGEDGLSLQGEDGVPQLLISGPPDKLENQVRFLTDSSINMAVGRRAFAEQLHTGPAFPGDSVTLGELGQLSLTAAGIAPQLGIPLDQTMFGHSIQEYRLHLLGSYTPVPSTFGGQLTLSVNGETLESWPAEAAGVIDRWVSIPDRLINRYTRLLVSLNTTGNAGRCNEYRPITLTINGNSVVETTAASPPVPPGFGSLPQALMPDTQVGIPAESFPDTARAMQIAAGLQRLSVMQLRTEVTTIEQALAVRQPAIIVSPDGWDNSSITLPVSVDGGRITLEGLNPDDPQTALTLDPGARFASLQTLFDGQRSLLIATSNGAPAQLDELLRWLNADSDAKRWTQVRGSAVVAFPGRTPAPVMVSIPAVAGGPMMSDTAGGGGPADGGLATVWWIVGLLAAVGVGGVAWTVLKGRRKG